MKITHLKHKDIDKEKWDYTISNSQNHMFYAFSWYLDIVSPDWEALIAENYLYLMPLPVKKKYFLKYIVQPILTQQLGIFSSETIDEKTINKFLKRIPYLSYELNFNEKNFSNKFRELPNYVLNLDKSYAQISGTYSKNNIRNIIKAQNHSLKVVNGIQPDVFFDFIISSSDRYDKNLKKINDLICEGVSRNVFQLFGVSDDENTMIATLCVSKSKERIVYLLPVSNENGKLKSAMFFLVDYLIQKYSNSFYVLDFEGSKIEGIARFYKGFGATLKPYYMIKRCRPNQTTIYNISRK
jgi:hypothetical protein